MKVSDYEILYDLPTGEYDDRGAKGVRTVTVRAGRSLEVMCHPIVKLTPEARREARSRRTSPAVQKINQQNRQRHIMRLLEENFPATAFVLTLTYAYPVEDYGMANLDDLADTYDKRGLPWDVERVRKDVRNYLKKIGRRVERWLRETTSSVSPSASHLPLKGKASIERPTKGRAEPASAAKQDAGETRGRGSEASCEGRGASFKWLIVIEEGKTPPMGGLPPRYHIHAVIDAPGVSRDEIEALWEEKQGRAHCERFRLKDDGAAQLAKYLGKQMLGGAEAKHGGRWWSHSRNLKIPEPRISDRAVSRRRMRRIAADIQRNGREILEKLYPGYRVVELPDVRFSDFVAGCYIYARMRRRD